MFATSLNAGGYSLCHQADKDLHVSKMCIMQLTFCFLFIQEKLDCYLI